MFAVKFFNILLFRGTRSRYFRELSFVSKHQIGENVNARFSDKFRPQNNDDDFQQYTINFHFQQLLKLEKGRTNIFSFSLTNSISLLT